jgi:PAS domain S-box-containing protein
VDPRRRYRLLFENSKDAVFITAPDGRLIDINPAGVELFGYASREEMLRLDLMKDLYVDPAKRDAFLRDLAGAGYLKDYRVELRRKDGKRLILLVTATAVRNDRGDIVENQGILHDITERSRAEQALAESEERLKLTLEAAHMVAWEINADGSHHEAGPVHELFGRPEGFRHPKLSDLFESVHPEDREGFREMVASALRGEREYNFEFRVPQPDGPVRWIGTAGTLQRDAEGKPVRILGMAQDITRRKAAEGSLQRSEERFKRLVLNSNDVFSLIDENGRHISLGGPIEKILGYKPEEVEGSDIVGLWHPDDAEFGRKEFLDVLAHPGETRSMEYRLRHRNGSWVTVESTVTNLLRDPAINAVVAYTRDISERKRLQEQLQQAMKMEAVGRLAGGVAHDFNNILTVISGNLELARMGLSPSDPLDRRLDQAAKAADSAASLTRQLLAFSRKQIISPRVLSLNDLVRNVRKMLGRLIGENVELKTVLANDLGSVKVDPGQFEQVLVNLAVNARDAMPEGGKLTIETANVDIDGTYCSTHPDAQPGRYALLAVSDTGHGMTDEVKSHLFEPFFTTKEKGHGTGLGLATTFGIVKQAGGNIEVYSEPGRGSTFKIYLPRIDERAEKLPGEAVPLDRLKGGETILLVEDEESVRQVASTILKGLGYRTIEARSGEEALMLAERHDGRIDLLMTDIVMPGMNGRELAGRLAAIRPEMKTLFTSGYTEDVIVHHGILDSNLDFIGKPYSVQALAARIREVLGPGKRAG